MAIGMEGSREVDQALVLADPGSPWVNYAYVLFVVSWPASLRILVTHRSLPLYGAAYSK